MIVDFPCICLAPCRCGFKPTSYSVAYGRRPYDVFCPTCRRQATSYCDGVGGYWWNIVWLWNKIAGLTDAQIKKLKDEEGDDFAIPPEDVHEYWSPS